MTDRERAQKIEQGTRVLRRRELEDYLYDPAVLRTFLKTSGCEEDIVEDVLNERTSLMNGQAGPVNVKDVSRKLFAKIRDATRLPNLGNTREEFASQHLVPALREPPRRVRGAPRGRVRSLTVGVSRKPLRTVPDHRTEMRSDARKLDRIRLLIAYGSGGRESRTVYRASPSSSFTPYYRRVRETV